MASLLSRASPAEARQQFYERMAGAAGAAFVTTALLELQDAPVDVCNLFHGELGGFGLFNEHGVPQKNYHALRAFSTLLATPRRVETRGSIPGRLALIAGVKTNATAATILVCNFGSAQTTFRLSIANIPWTSRTKLETRLVSATDNLERIVVQTNAANHFTTHLELAIPSVGLLQLRSITD